MTDDGILKLQQFEGFSGKPYTDTMGKLSIGFGRNLDDRGISRDEADVLFRNDVAIATAETRQNFPFVDQLDPVRQDFLVMMAFNIGVPRLKGFERMLAAIERHDWHQAEAELRDSRWSGQVGSSRLESMCAAIRLGKWA